ncbi:MAG: DASS family sodium-coupled anion symporter [Rhodothermia bacterium]|nr:DASS family sodium-coupled anion symporter [Rhodothermia bacterium]
MTESERSSLGREAPPSAFGVRQKIGLVAGVGALLIVQVTEPPGDMPQAAWLVAGAGLLIAIWWISEAISIFATSLLPLVLLPLLGVSTIADAASPYANPLIFLFMGGFMIATAMERWNLHKRIALTIVSAVGTAPRRMVIGFMAASAFLSMWVSNTATAMMILPIGVSVIALAATEDGTSNDNFGIVLMLAIAYACSIGGMCTLIGTPTNALFAALMLDQYGVDISFAKWFLLALPLVAIGLVIVYLVLVHFVYPMAGDHGDQGRDMIRRELKALGRMSRGEKSVGVVFGMVGILWMSRPLIDNYVTGVSDPLIAIAGALALFVIPVDWRRGTFVLNWEWARKIPWGVLILFGGGLSLAAAIQQSGLADWLGAIFGQLSNWPLVGLMVFSVALIILLTELTSNTATAAAFLPILASVSIGIGQNPLVLMVPATVAASCAFMLPVATPPNAIVYGSGRVTIPEMARAGIVLNTLFVILITATMYLLLPFAFDVAYGTIPEWATAFGLGS